MLRSTEAVRQAGVKPDDQIWLTVFGAMQEMLAHRAACVACGQVMASGERRHGNPPASSTGFVARLSPWKRMGRTPSGR